LETRVSSAKLSTGTGNVIGEEHFMSTFGPRVTRALDYIDDAEKEDDDAMALGPAETAIDILNEPEARSEPGFDQALGKLRKVWRDKNLGAQHRARNERVKKLIEDFKDNLKK
jgi:hypothetical protein